MTEYIVYEGVITNIIVPFSQFRLAASASRGKHSASLLASHLPYSARDFKLQVSGLKLGGLWLSHWQTTQTIASEEIVRWSEVEASIGLLWDCLSEVSLGVDAGPAESVIKEKTARS